MTDYHFKTPFKKCIGIDPGKSGGIAVIEGDGTTTVYKCPTTVKDMALLIGICLNDVAAYRTAVYLEKVWAFPTDAKKAAFTFGTNYGQWQGILASHELEIRYVTPKEWQAHFNIEKGLPKQIRKRQLKDIAIKSNPETKRITLSTADALLIAMYGKEAMLSAR